MRKYIYCCDCCGEEIPTYKKKDIFGIEREYFKFGKLNYGCMASKNITIERFGVDLCERCAEIINLKTEITRLELLTKTTKG